MQRTTVLAALVFMLLGATASAHPSAPVERGAYLTRPAGQCADCHGASLGGGPIGFLKPGMPVQYTAPKIAGLPMFAHDADAVRFLETGELPDRKHARPPMPAYRFSHADAFAIVAYLRSLR